MTEEQFIAVPSGIPHLCSPDRENPFRFIVLYIPVDFLNIREPEFSLPRIGKSGSSVILETIDSLVRTAIRGELDENVGSLQRILNRDSSPLDGEWGKILGETTPSLDYPQGNRFQIYRYARKNFGIGQKKISTIEKMEQAKKLLSEGEDLVEIALKCGFYDQSHFNKVFKLYTGLTPSQYLSSRFDP
ncbi:MAG: helix-turn-helix transcriptional regulator [Spirochaetales bacterium]|nr:helix-turn-helix transcriptional regulator [Spirochaetales bacterium]